MIKFSKNNLDQCPLLNKFKDATKNQSGILSKLNYLFYVSNNLILINIKQFQKITG